MVWYLKPIALHAWHEGGWGEEWPCSMGKPGHLLCGQAHFSSDGPMVSCCEVGPGITSLWSVVVKRYVASFFFSSFSSF